MKITPYLSVISIIIALIVIYFKLQLDISFYDNLKKVYPNEHGDFTPSLVVIGIRTTLVFLIPILTSLIISIKGIKKRNRYRKLALTINILAIIYLIVPVGAIIMVVQSTM
ncbi:hypothetical protein [uncultured Dokdonia sp.]|uniref:hypothetical protein n=1 Tax=uncultured Dokdonia sp. TaxID=575653 RepID=UPI00261DBD26|nr:hypothetical protein [uncultured Dokdonia sp.]